MFIYEVGCYFVVENVMKDFFIVNLFEFDSECCMFIIMGFNMGGKLIYMC